MSHCTGRMGDRRPVAATTIRELRDELKKTLHMAKEDRTFYRVVEVQDDAPVPQLPAFLLSIPIYEERHKEPRQISENDIKQVCKTIKQIIHRGGHYSANSQE